MLLSTGSLQAAKNSYSYRKPLVVVYARFYPTMLFRYQAANNYEDFDKLCDDVLRVNMRRPNNSKSLRVVA